jgi:hypothetical protein
VKTLRIMKTPLHKRRDTRLRNMARRRVRAVLDLLEPTPPREPNPPAKRNPAPRAVLLAVPTGFICIPAQLAHLAARFARGPFLSERGEMVRAIKNRLENGPDLDTSSGADAGA